MKIKNRLISLLLATAVVGSASALVSCKGGKNAAADNDQTLEVFVTNAGYGTQWLVRLLKAFKEEEWVKEKYPNLEIPGLDNDLKDYMDSITIPADKVTSGGTVNTADLVISCQPANTQYNAKDSSGNGYFEELSSVYDSEVPGESGVKVKDKMDAVVYDALKVTRADGATGYYAMPWVRGMTGFFYNETRLKSLIPDVVMPKTTDEFVALVKEADAKVKAQNSKDAAFLLDSIYLGGCPTVWWAQYEGFENYSDYWNCVVYDGETDEKNYSPDIFRQQGRLEALKVMEQVLGGGEYVAKISYTNEFMQRQTKLVRGTDAVFTDNGDWIVNEMDGVPGMQVMNLLKTPVVSAITDKLASVKTDAQLSLVVGFVDEEKTYDAAAEGYSAAGYGTLAESDYNRVFDARNMINRMQGHEMFVPAYATAKEVAKDFLRFTATDKAIRIFTAAGSGYVSPFNADVSDLYADFNAVGKTHHDWMKHAVELPAIASYRSAMFGGLTAWGRYSHSLGSAIAPVNAGERKTAQGIYNDIISDYTANNGAAFKLILTNAGFVN